MSQHIDEESIKRTASRLESAATEFTKAANQMDETVRRMEALLAEGYGGNGVRLIEALENVQVPPAYADMVVMEFSHDEVPIFSQGYAISEVVTPVTAQRCTDLVNIITELRATIDRHHGAGKSEAIGEVRWRNGECFVKWTKGEPEAGTKLFPYSYRIVCPDGGACHHGCLEPCARRDKLGCVPLAFSGLDSNWGKVRQPSDDRCITHALRLLPFDEAWTKYASDCQYGEDALTNVKFGYELALAQLNKDAG